MEKRTILFIILSIVIWVVYMELVLPHFVKPQKPTPSSEETTPLISPTGGEQKPPSLTQSTSSITTSRPTEFTQPSVPLEKRIIETNLLKAVFTNQGAALESLTLKAYLDAEGNEPLKLIDLFKEDSYSLCLSPLTGLDLGSARWEILSTREPNSLKFRYTTEQGLVIYKEFVLEEDSYAFKFNVLIENRSDEVMSTPFIINGIAGLAPEVPNRTDLMGMRAYTDGKGNWKVKKEIDLAKLQKEAGQGEMVHALSRDQYNVAWCGLVNKYFAGILIPLSAESTENISQHQFALLFESTFPEEPSTNLSNLQLYNINYSLLTTELSFNPGAIHAFEFLVYAGPKDLQELNKFTHLGIDKLVSYGIFGFISKILLGILGFFYGIFGNYGVAIIVLTILVKLVLFPLTKKGQVSMHQLQKITPKIKALQNQYKNDKQRLAMEQMKLWKEHGVNPIGGCLPMFFQMPIFIGLYWGLSQFIELRHSPFMLWISDLSQPDRLCQLPAPIFGATHLHILPLAMTLTWVVQSLTQPRSPDPQQRSQQKLFMFMPIVFGFLFYNVPSGLTLYWFTSTLLGIIEQLLIRKYYFR